MPDKAATVLDARAKIGRATRFGVVGATGTAVNTGVLYLLSRGAGRCLNVATGWLLTRSGVYFLAANLVAIAAAVTANYVFSVAWAWRQVA